MVRDLFMEELSKQQMTVILKVVRNFFLCSIKYIFWGTEMCLSNMSVPHLIFLWGILVQKRNFPSYYFLDEMFEQIH